MSNISKKINVEAIEKEDIINFYLENLKRGI